MSTFTGHIHGAAIIFDWADLFSPSSLPICCLPVSCLSLWQSVSTDILVWCLFGEEIEGMRSDLIGHWWWTLTSYIIELKKEKRQTMRGIEINMGDMEVFSPSIFPFSFATLLVVLVGWITCRFVIVRMMIQQRAACMRHSRTWWISFSASWVDCNRVIS